MVMRIFQVYKIFWFIENHHDRKATYYIHEGLANNTVQRTRFFTFMYAGLIKVGECESHNTTKKRSVVFNYSLHSFDCR